jgi:hypothetical protein
MKNFKNCELIKNFRLSENSKVQQIYEKELSESEEKDYTLN